MFSYEDAPNPSPLFLLVIQANLLSQWHNMNQVGLWRDWMATISLCMIVKDEELTLERCMQCAKGFADEIVVVDTGSGQDKRNCGKICGCGL